nr:aromatic peroxygenase [Quercus suber]
MKHIIYLLGLTLQATAFPAVLQNVAERQLLDTYQPIQIRQNSAGSTAAVALSKARKNCGVNDCLVFSATEQYVSTTGEHAYASPAADEIRGPCPGLNAAANHGYLSRSGVTTILETITGMGALYGMSPDLAGFLAAYAVLIDGDPLLGTWSIGGPPPSDSLTKGLLGQAQGISYSHNNYEGDASICRFDAFLNNGDAHSLDVGRFKDAYQSTESTDRYSLDAFAQNYAKKAAETVATNPHAFFAPFSGLVAPAAYNFVINFMSNHSAEEPNGYFDGNQFKQFFAISGTYPNFKWNRGQERIPENWYRRTSTNQYNVVNVFEDLGVQFLAYPDSFKIGGNTAGVNTFAGLDLGDLTSGVFNATNLFEGHNFACFFSQIAQAAIPDLASLALSTVSAITDLVDKYLKLDLDCPIVDKYDQTLFNQYPGHTYSPSGPATNY